MTSYGDGANSDGERDQQHFEEVLIYINRCNISVDMTYMYIYADGELDQQHSEEVLHRQLTLYAQRICTCMSYLHLYYTYIYISIYIYIYIYIYI